MSMNKKKLRIALYIYIALMLVIIFSSKTIYNFSLPKVVAAMPQSGRLSKEMEARGLIAYSETYDIYAPSSGQIDDILIAKGGVIRAGATIASYKVETGGATDGGGGGGRGGGATTQLILTIERIKNQLAALNLNKAALQEQLHAIDVNPDELFGYQQAVDDANTALARRQAELNAAREQAKTPIDDYVYRQAIVDAETEWKRKQIDAENTRRLEEVGAVAPIEVVSAQSAADDAERTYNRAVEALAQETKKTASDAQAKLTGAENAVADAWAALEHAEANLGIAEKAQVTRLDSELKNIDSEQKRIDLEIANANLDLRAAEALLADATKTNSDAGIISEYSGVVISVEKNRGQYVSQGEKIASVGIDNNKFVSEIYCQKSEGQFIEIGDEAKIYTNGVAAAVRAFVYDISPAEDLLKISLSCESDKLAGGEYVVVKINKQTVVYEMLIPNEAVFREGAGSYVWVVRGRTGALGTEYYSVKIKVFIADSDAYYTAISKGLEFFEPIAISFDKDLAPNGRVSRMEF